MDGAILRAAIELLSEVGYARLTVAEVARRAGVSKPAIYRRWAQKSQLVVEAMVTQMPTRVPPDTGSTSGDLLALTNQLLTTLTKTPMGRVAAWLGGGDGRRSRPGSQLPRTRHRAHPNVVAGRGRGRHRPRRPGRRHRCSSWF